MIIICNSITYHTFPIAKIGMLNKLETFLKEALEKESIGNGLKQYWFIVKILPDDYIQQVNGVSNEFRHVKTRKKYVYAPVLLDFEKVKKMSQKNSDKILFALFMDSIDYLEGLQIKDFDIEKFKQIALRIGKEQKWV